MHFKSIDQLRGVAALAVVLCHAAASAETVSSIPPINLEDFLGALTGRIPIACG